MTDVEKNGVGHLRKSDDNLSQRQAAPIADIKKGQHNVEDDRSSTSSDEHSLGPPVPYEDPDTPEPAHKIDTNNSAIRPDIVKVDRAQRRGLLASLSLIPEVTVPTDYPNKTKWIITGIGKSAKTTNLSTWVALFGIELLNTGSCLLWNGRSDWLCYYHARFTRRI
jgi:hypothetical protein